MSEEPPEAAEAFFRNGSVTVAGVIVGSSPSDLAASASSSSPWQLQDLIGIVPVAGGAFFQLLALSAMLRPNSLERPRYDCAIRRLPTGFVLVCLGPVAAIAADAITVAQRS